MNSVFNSRLFCNNDLISGASSIDIRSKDAYKFCTYLCLSDYRNFATQRSFEIICVKFKFLLNKMRIKLLFFVR